MQILSNKPLNAPASEISNLIEGALVGEQARQVARLSLVQTEKRDTARGFHELKDDRHQKTMDHPDQRLNRFQLDIRLETDPK